MSRPPDSAVVPCLCGGSARYLGKVQHPMLDPEALELLAELKAERLFVHLLGCPECRDLALADLGGVDQGAPVPRASLLADQPARLAAEALFEELIHLASQQLEVFQDDRFHDPVLLDLILEKGEAAARKRDFSGAADLAWLAVDLASSIASEDFWVLARLARAFFLAGSARRVAGDLKQAEAAFDSGSFYLTGGALERGYYCRDLALLRWDQHSPDQAAGLLRRGAEAFAESRRREEEAVCLALLGLLLLEEGEPERAFGPLLRARSALVIEARPWLTVRCSLSLALCLAAHARNQEARRVLEDSWKLYPLIQDEAELSVIKWLEGKVASWLGEFVQAHSLLDSARQELLAQRRLVEAGLASLDLAALYHESQRPGEIRALVTDLKRAGQDKEAAVAIELLQRFGRGDLIAPPRACAALYGAHLLKMARSRRLGAPPVPWV